MQSLAAALRALRRREVLRWLALLEAADLLLDVLFYFLALYLVDVAGWSVVEAAARSRRLDRCGPGRRRAPDSSAPVRPRARVPAGKRSRGPRLLPAVPRGSGALAEARAAGRARPAQLPAGMRFPRQGSTARSRGKAGRRSRSVASRASSAPRSPLGVGVAAEVAGLGATMWALLASPVILLVLTPRR